MLVKIQVLKLVVKKKPQLSYYLFKKIVPLRWANVVVFCVVKLYDFKSMSILRTLHNLCQTNTIVGFWEIVDGKSGRFSTASRTQSENVKTLKLYRRGNNVGKSRFEVSD